jgi:hypothetical protein
MKMLLFAALGFVCLTIGWVRAQTPAPVILQAATQAPAAAAPIAKAAGAAAADLNTMVQILQEMQATNAATIKKQEATLGALDELQKAAEELKIFSKRG